MNKVIEIRSYTLEPGTRSRFHKLVTDESVPMLQRWLVDVVRYGPSSHDQDSYYLIRAYDSLAEREKSQSAFYGSEEWKGGPREAIKALITSYNTIVIDISEEAIEALRMLHSSEAGL